MRKTNYMAVIVMLLALSTAHAENDWNQWRGADKDGRILDGPALVNAFPEEGPTEVWKIEGVPGDGDGGYASLSISDGKGFLFVNWKHHEPIDERLLTQGELDNLGYPATKLPEELRAKVEEVRMSKERNSVRGWTNMREWVKDWVKNNLTDEERKEYGRTQAKGTNKKEEC